MVPGEVTGGQVGEGKGRLDFNLPEGGLDKDAIATAINRLVEDVGRAALPALWLAGIPGTRQGTPRR